MFNTTYKIFAKALQRRLQPLLVEVIDSNQVAFLAPRFILDNILLTHESIQWAKWSRQDSIFCELDLSKAYDRVGWTSSNMQSLLRYHIKQLQPYHSSWGLPLTGCSFLLLYQRRVISLASYCSIMEGDDTHGDFSFSILLGRYSTN